MAPGRCYLDRFGYNVAWSIYWPGKIVNEYTVKKQEAMAKTTTATRLHRRWELARIHHYVQQHDDCAGHWA